MKTAAVKGKALMLPPPVAREPIVDRSRLLPRRPTRSGLSRIRSQVRHAVKAEVADALPDSLSQHTARKVGEQALKTHKDAALKSLDRSYGNKEPMKDDDPNKTGVWSDGRVVRMSSRKREIDRISHEYAKAYSKLSGRVDDAKLDDLKQATKEKLVGAAARAAIGAGIRFVGGYIRKNPGRSLAIGVGAGAAGYAGYKAYSYVKAYRRGRNRKKDTLRTPPIPKRWRQSWLPTKKPLLSESLAAFGPLLRGGVRAAVRKAVVKRVKKLRKTKPQVC